MNRIPIRSLAKLASAWASPEMDRPVYWRTLIGRDTWALLLITKGKPGDPPARPERTPNMRLSPDWARRTGADLTPDQLLYERISQHLRAHAQDKPELGIAHAAASMLAEYGIHIAHLQRPAPEEKTDA